jgi:hypothetical protein
MEASTKLFDLLRDLLEQLPSLLTLLVCMVVAIVRWKKHPRVSLAVLMSLAFLFFHLLVSAFAYNWVPDWFINAAPIANQASVTRNVYLVLGLVTNASLAVGLAILLTGIFMQRVPTNE